MKAKNYIIEFFKDNGYKYSSDVETPFNYLATRKDEKVYVMLSDDYERHHRQLNKSYKELCQEQEGVDIKVWLVANFKGNGLNLYEYKEDRYTFTLCNFKLEPRSKFKRIFKLTAY